MSQALTVYRSPKYVVSRSRLRAQYAANLTSLAVMTALYQQFNDEETRKWKRNRFR